MDIYKKLPIDIQLVIIDYIHSKIQQNYLFPEIINTRNNLIYRNIISICNCKNILYGSLYFWFCMNKNRWINYNLTSNSSKIIDSNQSNFIVNLFPNIKNFDKFVDLYIYCKQKYKFSYTAFNHYFIKNLSLEDKEDYYNYIEIYRTGIDNNINKSPLISY